MFQPMHCICLDKSEIIVQICFFRYVNNFTKTKEDLTARLFKLYNETVFEYKV